MKSPLLLLVLVGFFSPAWAQFRVTETRTWEQYPPEVQKPGFGLHAFQQMQMDDGPALEEILLFSAHNGHYPYFDVFKNYFVVLDNYSKAVKFISDVTLSTKREMLLEDRNQDGKFELYRSYFLKDQFSVDEFGNKLAVIWAYDRIEWNPEEKYIEKKQEKAP